ncbi:MAG: lysoplasmalogenase [Saprospiraceae bacterium]
MERKITPSYIIFIAIAVFHVGCVLFDNTLLANSSKVVLMQLLCAGFLISTPGIRRFLRHTVLVGLVFSLIGDFFLIFTNGAYGEFAFLVGLGAFLITHLCYLGGFLSEVSLRSGFLRKQPFWAALFVVFLVGFLAWLWPGIPEGLRLPVVAYGSAITAMSLSALNWRGRFEGNISRNLLIGALLFMLSDCLLAIARFGQPFEGAQVGVVATYLVGQWLIIRAVEKRLLQKK